MIYTSRIWRRSAPAPAFRSIGLRIDSGMPVASDIRGGRHNLTAGFDVLRAHVNGVESSSHLGVFSFRNDFVDESGQARDAITNLRLGTPSYYLRGLGNTHRGFRYWDLQYFVGDDWRVNSDLTLHFGIRYQPLTSPVEVNGLSELPYDATATTWLRDSVSPIASVTSGERFVEPMGSISVKSSGDVRAVPVQPTG